VVKNACDFGSRLALTGFGKNFHAVRLVRQKLAEALSDNEDKK
jgi:hypothetical protein